MSYALFPLKPLLILAALGLVVALTAAIAFALSSPASKTIALATAALFGAAALFILQLLLELRASKESDFVSVEFTVDRAKPVLRQWRYPVLGPPWRLAYEEGASAWLAQNSPAAFSGDRERLTHDFALAEILLFFAREQFDWQLAKTSFTGSTFGRLVTTRPVSKKDDCTEVGPADFAAALRKAGSALAGYELLTFPGRPVCFPPDTTMILSDSSLTLSNPFGSLQFSLVPSGSLSHMKPGTDSAEVPTLPNGEPQFETRLVGIRIINGQAALYSQHRDAAKQAAWRKRVISELHSWFEQR
jgi:hypothetical protein